MSLYGTVNRVYRILPGPARRWADERAPEPVRRLRGRIVSRLAQRAQPDELYDGHYYDEVVDPIMLESAEAIAGSIARELAPRAVIDVGCGSGALMLALERREIACTGYDLAEAALARCRERGLRVARLDILRDPVPSVRADLVVSTEVAEHLPETGADRFVDLLTILAPTALITAAPPGSGGKDHLNEQPGAYWIARFAERGFAKDEALSARLRQEWREAGASEVHHRSLMVFRALTRRSPAPS